ncbi:hypothetical protein [Clostridium akagii]|uniref:hypothetical protein n=1 Tax=Clostridium akagii TaxID=91623 RepID=UPI00047CD339|nr:hypothetical protein [Clostridium akagii]
MDIFGHAKNLNEEQWHTKFKLLKEDDYSEGEREILRQWVDGLVDRDHKMVQEFQKTFHASFWEFYLYACFKEAGFTLDQSHNRPDFMIKAPYEVNVEAVVANIKDQGRPESDRGINDLMDMFIPPKNQDDFYNIQHEAIVRQSNAITSKIKKYENEYVGCEWVKSDIPFVIAMSSYGQVNYGREFIYPMLTLLYGMYYIPEQERYKLVNEIPKPRTEATIPVGLFNSDKYSDISAILYSCTTTLGKLTSLAKSSGYYSMNEVYNLRRDYKDTRIPYKLQHVSEETPECLTDGLFLFHNPHAKNKLDIICFENTNVTQFFWDKGKLKHTSNTYPIVCRLNFPHMLEQDFTELIQEYMRQYNDFSPMEFYSIDPSQKMIVDFDKNCLICAWVIMKEEQQLRNIHYERPQFLTDEYLEKEALMEVRKRTEEIEKISSIDIVRTKERFYAINR